MCLAGDVVASWSLTQEVVGSYPFTVMANIFSYWIQRIQWKHLVKSQMWSLAWPLSGHYITQKWNAVETSQPISSLSSLDFLLL